jgi:hypothetical protein
LRVRQSPDREAQPEQREQHRGQLSRTHRRNSKNAVASQRDDQVRNQIPPKVGKDKFRSRVATKYLRVSGSARRHRWAQVNVSNAVEARRLDFVNR